MTQRADMKRGARTRTRAAGGAPRRSTHIGDTAPKGKDSGARSKRPKGALAAGLYIVATPIGNAGDITARALDVLGDVDIVACEDTRVTGKLLAMHGAHAGLTPYHEHNAARARPALIDRMVNGQAVALVADAGTPLVSDPGYKLVVDTIAAGLAVLAVPGASAPIAALTVSGLPSDRFLFAGFLPPRQAARRKALAELATVGATLVLLESPRRLAAALADMAEVLGARPAAVARELTKLFEEVRRGTLAELASHYRASGAPKGEIVVVVGPPTAVIDDDALDARLHAALARLSVRDAASSVALATGVSRRRLYARALELAGQR